MLIYSCEIAVMQLYAFFGGEFTLHLQRGKTQNAENPQHRRTLTAKKRVQIVRAFKSPQMRTGHQSCSGSSLAIMSNCWMQIKMRPKKLALISF
ncbi:hypothetical protein DMP59_03590 [Klebsiella pneumoniae]|nr:hypothetical protein DMP59_03590 [Klebsiella pneumoniae]